MNVESWIKSRNLNHDVIELIRELDENLNNHAGDVRFLKSRISYGPHSSPHNSAIIIFPEGRSVKLQIQKKFFDDNTWNSLGFGAPAFKNEAKRDAFAEIKVKSRTGSNKNLLDYLKKGLV